MLSLVNFEACLLAFSIKDWLCPLLMECFRSRPLECRGVSYTELCPQEHSITTTRWTQEVWLSDSSPICAATVYAQPVESQGETCLHLVLLVVGRLEHSGAVWLPVPCPLSVGQNRWSSWHFSLVHVGDLGSFSCLGLYLFCKMNHI